MSGIKPQDVVVLLKLLTFRTQEKGIRQVDLALSLSLSQSEVHKAFSRAKGSGLLTLNADRRTVGASQVRRDAFLEYVVHGLKYACPVRSGEQTRGLATAWALPAVCKGLVVSSGDGPVWPWHNGATRGPAVEPLYRSVPEAASRDAALHELLALVDLIRIGRVRDREHAIFLLKQRLAPCRGVTRACDL
jgi:hypothetical protein